MWVRVWAEARLEAEALKRIALVTAGLGLGVMQDAAERIAQAFVQTPLPAANVVGHCYPPTADAPLPVIRRQYSVPVGRSWNEKL